MLCDASYQVCSTRLGSLGFSTLGFLGIWGDFGGENFQRHTIFLLSFFKFLFHTFLQHILFLHGA